MAETNYSYPITNPPFPNGKMDSDSLKAEIEAAALGQALLRINTFDSTCEVVFDGAVSQADLDAVIEAHQGEPPPGLAFVINAAIGGKTVITEDQTWEEIDGKVSNPGQLVAPIEKAVGQVTGAAKVSGTGAELKLTEDDGSTEVDTTSSPYVVADTAGAWVPFVFYTDVVPRASRNIYRLKGRLNGAASMEVKYGSISVLRKTP